MLKLGFKASHFQKINKVGTIVNIERVKNNQMTVGGTTEARVFITLRYDDGTEEVCLSTDLIRQFD
jgi:tRNA(Phe) wybutosine-synthesizing methylase Tyw3